MVFFPGKILKNCLEKVQKNGPAGRKRQGGKSNRIRQKNKRGDSKVGSNDSPEIPDVDGGGGGETQVQGKSPMDTDR